jgi:hypothetical protein
MATIKTLPAGVSPYQAAAAAVPTVLVTTTNGRPSTVAASTSVIVNGQAALNSLITTSQTGVFQGANVTINLEEQNFSTTNQVTSNTNYPSGNTGEIQYNSGANSFASDPYFTYTNSNVVTPGIRTNGYFYGNGAPFIGGGNAAIGNFVFSGDIMSISDANQVMSISGNGTGNIRVTSNGNIWTFNNVGNLTLPTNTSSINYANGVPYGVNYSNSNVSSFMAAFGSNVVSTTGNISAGYFVGNGSQLTGIASSYGNANVVANLAALGSNPVSTTGNITAGNLDATNLVINSIRSDDSSFVTIRDGLSVDTGLISAPGNLDISAGIHTWIFEANGNLTFPTGMHIDDEGANTRISQNTGYLKVSAGSNAGIKLGWVEFEGSGTGNTAEIVANGGAPGYPGNLVIEVGNQSTTTYKWVFDNQGDLTAPGNIYATNLVINSIRSDDSTFVTIEDGVNVTSGLISAPESMLLTAGANTWTFGTDGILTLANGATLKEGVTLGALALGYQAGQTSQGIRTVAIGEGTGQTSQGARATAVGAYAGSTSQGGYSVAVGWNAGQISQGGYSVAVGAFAGATSQGNNSIIINATAANLEQTTANTFTVAPIRNDVANTGQVMFYNTTSKEVTYGNVISVAGNITAGNVSTGVITLTNGAVIKDTSGEAVAFGQLAGNTSQGNSATAVGYGAGQATQGQAAVAVGVFAGNSTQGDSAVAIGQSAGSTTQGTSAVAIGALAGNTTQGLQAVAIGLYAGTSAQGQFSVAVGPAAGQTTQGQESTAIGSGAGSTAQGNAAVAIGSGAGAVNQRINAVAIGASAGAGTQGDSAVAIGASAGVTNQGNNSIILNATGANLNQTTANTFTVAPIRNDVANTGQVMFYNTTSKEVTYGNVISVAGNITGGNISITGNTATITSSNYAIGYLNIPQVSFAGNATIAATDAGKHYYSTLSTANVLTIANNTSVSWAVGTAISLVNRGTGNITVAQGSGVSLYLAGNATAGNRTVATYGMATLMNVAANIWMINGTGVS